MRMLSRDEVEGPEEWCGECGGFIRLNHIHTRVMRIREEAQQRVKRLRIAAIGENRQFYGKILILSPEKAHGPNTTLVQDVDPNTSAVYWTDGDVKPHSHSNFKQGQADAYAEPR